MLPSPTDKRIAFLAVSFVGGVGLAPCVGIMVVTIRRVFVTIENKKHGCNFLGCKTGVFLSDFYSFDNTIDRAGRHGK